MQTLQRQSSFIRKRLPKASPADQGRSSAFAGPYAEERISSLFEPDILLPAEYLDKNRAQSYREPERRLMLAILQDAVSCFQAGLVTRSKRKQALCREAEEWIFDNEREWPFSFENLCEALDLDARYILKGLLAWKGEALNGKVKAKVYRITRRSGQIKTSVMNQRLSKAAGF